MSGFAFLEFFFFRSEIFLESFLWVGRDLSVFFLFFLLSLF